MVLRVRDVVLPEDARLVCAVESGQIFEPREDLHVVNAYFLFHH